MLDSDGAVINNKNNLSDYLGPDLPENQQPSVIDLDGTGSAIAFNNPAVRLVGDGTRVDVGDSPNSQTGDPLRTSFIKLDNFMEAVYRADAAKSQRLNFIQDGGRFRGARDYANLSAEHTRANFEPGDIVVLAEKVRATTKAEFESLYPLIFRSDTDEAFVNAFSFLDWNDTRNKFDVVGEITADEFTLDFGDAIDRYAAGTADTTLTPEEQRNLYQRYTQAGFGTDSNYRIDANNIEDGIFEILAKTIVLGNDAGYYG